MTTQHWKTALAGLSPLLGLALLSFSAHSKDIGVALSSPGVAAGKSVHDCGCTSSNFGFSVRMRANAFDSSGNPVSSCSIAQNGATVGATQWSPSTGVGSCGSPAPGVLAFHQATFEDCAGEHVADISTCWDTNFGSGTCYSSKSVTITSSTVCDQQLCSVCDTEAQSRTFTVYSFGR